jgi:hypothetical protein
MFLNTEKYSLIILGFTAIAGSRGLFFLFDDPEGPNLLIVAVVAVAVYLISLPVYALNRSNSSKRFWLAILAQAASVACMYILGITF